MAKQEFVLGNRTLNYIIVILALALGLIFAVGMTMRSFGSLATPPPQTVAAATLDSVKEQKRLSAFVANYTAVVTSEQEKFGLSAKKTLIMQGLVRYEVDLAKFKAEDIRWDSQKNTMHVRVPPIELAGPEINLKTLQEFDDGGILRLISNADAVLDAANRNKGQEELLRQAQAELPMEMARNAHRRAVQDMFEAPLNAAGLSARVNAFFAEEDDKDLKSRWEFSQPISKSSAH